MFGSTKSESWWHSPECDVEYRRLRVQRQMRFRPRAFQKNAAGEFVADPEEVSRCEREHQARIAAYFEGEQTKKRGGDPREALPSGGDLQALVDTFGAAPETLEQGLELQRRGLLAKAKRLVLCGQIGRRLNCVESETHRFFRPYMCGGRYCSRCGPAWFRRKFSDLLVALEPVVERLLHEGKHRGRRVVVARLDFTVPNRGEMPSPEFVRRFHSDLHRFWRAAERRFGLSRKEYGVGGMDEFGGSNTNLHRHSVYVGPELPQSKARKELSALWSEIRREPSFVSIKYARSFPTALAHALKYPAKFLNGSSPERLAELEATFHHTRRFATGGAFYGVEVMREPGEDSPIGSCPICGGQLYEIVEPWIPRFELESEGRGELEAVCRDVGRATVFCEPKPP